MQMVYTDAVLKISDWKITLTLHNDASEKQLGAAIIQNNKPFSFLSRRLFKTQQNYTIT